METYCLARHEVDRSRMQERAATAEFCKTQRFALQELDKGMRAHDLTYCHFEFEHKTHYVVARYKRSTAPLTQGTLDAVIEQLDGTASESLTDAVVTTLQRSLVVQTRSGVRLLHRKPKMEFESVSLPETLLFDAHTAADAAKKIASVRREVREERREAQAKMRDVVDQVEAQLRDATVEVETDHCVFRLRRDETERVSRSRYTVKQLQATARRVTAAYLRRLGVEDDAAANTGIAWSELKGALKTAVQEDLAAPREEETKTSARIVYHVV